MWALLTFSSIFLFSSPNLGLLHQGSKYTGWDINFVIGQLENNMPFLGFYIS